MFIPVDDRMRIKKNLGFLNNFLKLCKLEMYSMSFVLVFSLFQCKAHNNSLGAIILTIFHMFTNGTYRGSCRQLTESGLSKGPSFCISNTLQFLAMYCQSSQGCSEVVSLSGSVRSRLCLWIRMDSGKRPPN